MAKKSKVPKRIAGVKLPKPLRRGLRDLAASQTGRDALTDALEAAGAALSAQRNAPPADAATPDGKAAGRDVAIKALEEAARAFTETLRAKPTQSSAVVPPGPPPSVATH